MEINMQNIENLYIYRKKQIIVNLFCQDDLECKNNTV